MAFRSFLYLGDNMCKCVFTSVQLKPKLYTIEGYKQIRNFKKFRSKAKLSKISSINGPFRQQSEHAASLWKPFTFMIMFSGTTFIAAAIWEYEQVRGRAYTIIRNYKHWKTQRAGWRGTIQNWWNNLSEGEKVFVPICFLNVLVFLSWRIPAWEPIMKRYFCSNPASRTICWPMLLSTFSHYSFVHLVINMYVLYNFCTVAVSTLGREQFLAFYLTSGVISSFASCSYRAAFGIKDPALGASGAIMGILGFVCTQFPNTHLSIVFLPMLTFTASTGIKAMMAFDSIGCLMRWQRFDHAAHLGGALFGIFWQVWGNANIWQKREPVLMFWHQLRERPKSQ